MRCCVSTVARLPREGGLRRAIVCLDVKDSLVWDPEFDSWDLKVARFW